MNASTTDFNDRMLSLGLARVSEAAAHASARLIGRGDEKAADQAAVNAMREQLNMLDIKGVVVIGEGERDEAPMLYIGEEVGTGSGPEVDIALDPLEGTTLTAKGMNNAIAVLAAAPRGTMYDPSAVFYMEKLVVGPDAVDAIDITASTQENLVNIAAAKKRAVRDLTVCVLDRPRHKNLVSEIRAAGARIKFITDGDVAGAIAAASDGKSVDVLMGIGGTPEGIIAACALKCMGGAIQARLWPRDEDERAKAIAAGHQIERVLTTDDLVSGDNVFFCATGITDGELLDGVRYDAGIARTQSLVMRGRSGTIRQIDSRHRSHKLMHEVGA